MKPGAYIAIEIGVGSGIGAAFDRNGIRGDHGGCIAAARKNSTI